MTITKTRFPATLKVNLILEGRPHEDFDKQKLQRKALNGKQRHDDQEEKSPSPAPENLNG